MNHRFRQSWTLRRAAAGSREPVAAGGEVAAPSLYRAIWRWHFYAGLFCLPFMLSLAVSGGMYLFKDEISEWLYRDLLFVAQPPADGPALAPEATVALAANRGVARGYVPPESADRSARVIVEAGGARRAVFVDPYRGTVLGSLRQGDRGNLPFADVLRRVHSLEIAGPIGNRLVEIVAGWALILVATGVYLWWPRGNSAFAVRGAPRQRVFWRDLHAVTGSVAGLFVAFLAATGLPWSGVWGTELKQLVNAAGWGYPQAAVASAVPSAATHSEHSEHDLGPVPWTLGGAPSPQSAPAAKAPIGLDRAVSRFDELGLAKGYTVTLPADPAGVYSASVTPDRVAGSRSIRLDQYTGAVLFDVRYADYGAAARAIELGVSLHTGRELGRANQLVMLGACGAIVLLAASAAVMWWKRRPRGALGAPRYPADFRVPRAILAIAVSVGVLLPLVGLSIVVMLAIDACLPHAWRERVA